MDNQTGRSPLTTRSADLFLESSAEKDCILQGDFFELNDLVDPGSRSSSAVSSSCLPMTSDEYFDSIALLQELDDDITNQKIKDTSVKFNLSAPVKSKEVVLCPDTFVSLRNDNECKPCAQETSKVDNRNRSNSNVNAATSSSSSLRPSREGRKEHGERTKRRKMMKNLFATRLI